MKTFLIKYEENKEIKYIKCQAENLMDGTFLTLLQWPSLRDNILEITEVTEEAEKLSKIYWHSQKVVSDIKIEEPIIKG